MLLSSQKSLLLCLFSLYQLWQLVACFSPELNTGVQEVVRNQLGYVPSNFVEVSAWREVDGDKKEPVAIKTYPLHGGARRRQQRADVSGPIKSPFPTLYWLTCPEISRAVADLERRGYVKEIESVVERDTHLRQRLLQCHQDYALDRWTSLSQEDRALMLSESPTMVGMRSMIQSSGVSGTNMTGWGQHAVEDGQHQGSSFVVPPVKCLHAHYAHYRSTSMAKQLECLNPVGQLVHEQLQQDFPELHL